MIRCRIKSSFKLILLIILVLNCSNVSGRGKVSSSSDCTGKLAAANVYFEKGLYENCIASVHKLLSDCDLSREEREHALELLTKAYSEIPDEVQANRSAEILLNKYPHYELNEDQNFESFNRLIKKYKIHPALSIGIKNAIICLVFKTPEYFSMPDGSDDNVPYEAGSYFFSYYGWAEYEFKKDISINGDLMWWTSYYRKNFSHGTNLSIHYEERPVFVEIPLYLKKYYTIGKNFKPYVAAGLGWLYMTTAQANVSKFNADENMTYYINGLDVIDMRTRHNFEWLASAGLGYKIRNVRIFFDIRYFGGITSLTDPKNRLNNEQLLNDYYFQDNALRMNKFEMGASISYTFINSVKKVR